MHLFLLFTHDHSTKIDGPLSFILSFVHDHLPKIRVLIDLFLLFAHGHSTKMYGPLSYVLPLCTTIRPKIRFLINLFLLFAHDHSTKIRVYSYSLIYSFLNCANISYAIFMSVLFLYFVRDIHVSTALIMCTLYSWL